jgi:hypothetical protein
MFDAKWYMIQMHERDHDKTVNQHANMFTMVNKRNFEPGSEPCVLTSQCKQVFYSEVPRRGGLSYVVIFDPRGRSVKYNVVEEHDIEEEDDVEDQLFMCQMKTSYKFKEML